MTQRRAGDAGPIEILEHDVIRSCVGLAPADVAERIERAVQDFSQGPPRSDIAVLVVRTTE